jgi:hypothetical protein
MQGLQRTHDALETYKGEETGFRQIVVISPGRQSRRVRLHNQSWNIRPAQERQVNARVIPTRTAIDESVELAHEIFNRVLRRIPEKIESKGGGVT